MKLVDQCEHFLRDKIDDAVVRSTDGWLEIRGGDLEKELGWNRRMPIVSAAMYKVSMAVDEIRHQPPKGKGNNLTIAYNLAERRSGRDLPASPTDHAATGRANSTAELFEGRSRYRNVGRGAVLSAIHECDDLGREAFRDKYGFGRARSYVLVHDGREYDSKAILGVAYGYEFPDEGPLGPLDFSGGDATVRAHLESLGFDVPGDGEEASVDRRDDAAGIQRQRSMPDLVDDAADDLDSSGEFDAFDMEDARERIARQVAARAGQPQFRAALLKAYEGRCVLSGCPVVEVLEAAHIVPYRGDKSNHVTNGLLLRSDLHTLFDRGLLTVERRGDAIVARTSPHLADSPYAELDGRVLRAPSNPLLGPDSAALIARSRLNGKGLAGG